MKQQLIQKLKGLKQNLNEDMVSLREVNKLIEEEKAKKENIINFIKNDLLSKNLIKDGNDLSFVYLDNLIKINVLDKGKNVNTFSVVFEYSDRYYVCEESPNGIIYINKDLKNVKDDLIKLQSLNFKEVSIPTTSSSLYAHITNDGVYLANEHLERAKNVDPKIYKNIFVKKENLPKELLENNIRQKNKRR